MKKINPKNFQWKASPMPYFNQINKWFIIINEFYILFFFFLFLISYPISDCVQQYGRREKWAYFLFYVELDEEMFSKNGYQIPNLNCTIRNGTATESSKKIKIKWNYIRKDCSSSFVLFHCHLLLSFALFVLFFFFLFRISPETRQEKHLCRQFF